MEEKINYLSKFGLNSYDIKVFETLLYGGSMSAQEISKASHVPYPKVYASLKKLVGINWVKVEKGWPSKYYLASPDELVLRFKETEEEKIREFEEFVTTVVKPALASKGVTERSDVWLVNGYKAVAETLVETLKLTREEAKLAFPFELKEDILLKLKEALKNKDLKVKILTIKEVAKDLKKALPKAEIRSRDFLFGGGLISDSKSVVLILYMPQGEYTAIASNHPYLAALADSYFNYLWETAEV